jgi:multidrug resistance protein
VKQFPILVLFITIFFDLIGFGIVIPILPIYADELGASGFTIGLIGASFSAAQFVFAPFWGKLSDRIGRRPVILTCILIMLCSYLVLGMATSVWMLFAARIVAGIGAANISAAQAFISDITPPENRAKNFGIIGAAFGLGFIFGPPLGGWLKEDFGIEWVGFVAAGLAALNFILAYFLLPESIEKKQSFQLVFPNPAKGIKEVLPRPLIGALLLINFVFIAAFSMMQITSSLLWKDKYDLDAGAIGLVFAFIGFTVVVIQGTLIGRLTRWFGEKKLFILGNLLMAIGLFGMPYVPVDLFVPWEYIALLFISFGNAFFTPTLTSLLSKSAGKEEQGTVMGVSQSMGALSRIVGPFIGGFLYGIDLHLPNSVAAAVMLITFFMAWRIVNKYLGGKSAAPSSAAA